MGEFDIILRINIFFNDVISVLLEMLSFAIIRIQ